jgi:hypothetical protein
MFKPLYVVYFAYDFPGYAFGEYYVLAAFSVESYADVLVACEV